MTTSKEHIAAVQSDTPNAASAASSKPEWTTVGCMQEVTRAQSEEAGPSSAGLEGPVLMAINVERTQQGLDSAHKLTVQLLKAHLRGKFIDGQEWRAGTKKKEDLMYDYR